MDADTPTPISMTRIMATNTSGVGLNRLPAMALQAEPVKFGV